MCSHWCRHLHKLWKKPFNLVKWINYFLFTRKIKYLCLKWSKVFYISNIAQGKINCRTKKNTAVFPSYETKTSRFCTYYVWLVLVLSVLLILQARLFEAKVNLFGIPKQPVLSVSFKWQQNYGELKFGSEISAVVGGYCCK